MLQDKVAEPGVQYRWENEGGVGDSSKGTRQGSSKLRGGGGFGLQQSGYTGWGIFFYEN